VITEALAGRRILVTGATGFLGTALVERLLRCVPGSDVVLLVRPGQRLGAEERARREVFRNDCFDRLRGELGSRFDDELARRVTVVAGDVGRDGLGLDAADEEAVGGCDLAVHAAAAVSFDAPLDSAVEVNLLGPSRVAAALTALAGRHGRPLPHLVTVSTAYVNSGHKGDAVEEPLSASRFVTRVDWQEEVRAAERARADLDAESRSPERLSRFARQAREELGAAGTALLAEATERRRRDWVRDRMVELGRARARALGWPDAYAFTKALGERALLETRGDLPVSIVRPSIVESALAEPRPGWIRGFRMAEPVIVSYARGLLRQFPGIPEGVIDVVPVDLVVAAILAVAAQGPDPAGPRVYQVASGARNPLRYGELVALVEGWFTRHPLFDDRGQPIVVPRWSFPGRGRVQGELRRAAAVLGALERVLNRSPLRGAGADLAARVEERRAQAERALGYVELYGAYTETEARFRIDRTLALYESLDPVERSAFCFDPAVIDWRHYVEDVHLPSVVEHARVRSAPRRSVTGPRQERLRRAILAPTPRLVVFDLEHTLLASNVVETYAWLASRRLSPPERARVAAGLLAEAPRLLVADRRDRGDFLRSFYRRYEGARLDEIARDALEMFDELLLPRAFPAGIARVRQHRALGHRTLLVTGALDVVVAPLAPLFDEVVAARLAARDGVATGELAAAPPTGEARALLVVERARELGLDPDDVVAYADSTSDLPLLEAAGIPVAVNPEARLAAIARRRGWAVEHWGPAPGASRPLLPLPRSPYARRPGTRAGAVASLGGLREVLRTR
jgi:fatty acyl-CoA reductase